MRDYKPSDFTEEEQDEGVSRRKFLYAAGAGAIGGGAGILAYNNRDKILGDDNNICIHEDVLENYNVFNGEEPFRPNEDGFHEFLYKEEEDTWYVHQSYFSIDLTREVNEEPVNSRAIESILENTGDTEDYLYKWGEEVLEEC